MKKIILTIFIGLSITLTPFHTSLALNQDETNQNLLDQIAAIGSYITRTYGLVHQQPLTETDLRERIHSGKGWLITAQEPSGHFKYEYVPFEDEYLEDDNIVRQAGALFALGEIVRKSTEEERALKETIQNSIAYFEILTQEDIDRETDTKFACPVINEVSTTCLLGAASLAVTGMLGYIERYPEEWSTHEDRIESYIVYILSTQKDNGGFYDRHRIGAHTQSENESAFSNGEALLALVRYYQKNPREDVKDAIDRAFTYLESVEYDTALYLWIMAALKDMNALWPNDAYTTYGKAFTDWRISRASRFRTTQRNYCAYIEGVASAYTLLEDTLTREERETLKNEIDYWNTKNSFLQIDATDRYRVNQTENSLTLALLENPELALGGFLTAEDELTQRIDFTQHCLNTYLQTLTDIEQKQL